MNSSKIIETFDEYEDESDVTHIEKGIDSNQTSIYVKLPEIARRSSGNKQIFLFFSQFILFEI